MPSPPNEEGSGTSIQTFLELNPKLELLKQARNSKGGVWKLLDVALFGFTLFAPALPLMSNMKQPVYMLILWAIIVMIMWCKIEYSHRAEVWYICMKKGIIVDFPKTNTAKGWLLQIPTLFAILFLLVFGGVVYIGHFTVFDDFSPLRTAVLSIVGLIFVLLLTKSFVNLEGAPQLQTVNMLMYLFEDPELFQAKGFKLVHFSQLQAYVARKSKAEGEKISFSWDSFSWNEIHALSHTPDTTQGFSLIAGVRMWVILRKYESQDT